MYVTFALSVVDGIHTSPGDSMPYPPFVSTTVNEGHGYATPTLVASLASAERALSASVEPETPPGREYARIATPLTDRVATAKSEASTIATSRTFRAVNDQLVAADVDRPPTGAARIRGLSSVSFTLTWR